MTLSFCLAHCRARRCGTGGRGARALLAPRSLHIEIDERVRAALASGQPVVALESTILAHGMPYPENLLLSQRVAAILRRNGVEPATIGRLGKNRTM